MTTSRIDELQRLHEMYGRRHAMLALFDAWPAIHRVLVAARGLMEANDVSNWVMTSDGKLTDHGKMFEALRALDAHQD